MIMRTLFLLALVVALNDAHATVCATDDESQKVRAYYAGDGEGMPPPIPSRSLGFSEAKLVSGLPSSQAIGLRSSPDLFRRLWKSLDSWGADTTIKLVLTSGGPHAWVFPSRVPITQPDRENGMYDMYADEGKGVHGHIRMDDVDTIWLVELPTESGATRAVNFYREDGTLIVGVYASVAGDPYDQDAVDGFHRTWEAFQGAAPACASQ